MNAQWKAVCQCGWTTGYQASADKCRKMLKAHVDNDPHKDYTDVPMF